MPNFQFSLRGLFILMTIVAVAVAIAANYPYLALACLFLNMPLVIGRGVPFLFQHAPRVAVLFMFIQGATFALVCGYLARGAYLDHELGRWESWVGLMLLAAFSILCFTVGVILARAVVREKRLRSEG